MISDVYIYVSIGATAIVVAVPFFYGMRKSVANAIAVAEKAHKSKLQVFGAAANAAVTYIKAHPNQDKELYNVIADIAAAAGVVMPSASELQNAAQTAKDTQAK